MNQFGPLLRQRRRERGLTQSALARRIAYDQSLVSKLERGERPPTEDFVGIVVRALDLPAAEAVELRAAARLTQRHNDDIELPARRGRWRWLLWYIAGNTIWLTVLMCLFVRLYIAQGEGVRLYDFIDVQLRSESGPPGLLLMFLAVLVLSAPLGFALGALMHAIFSALDLRLGAHLTLTSRDLPYDILNDLTEHYGINYQSPFGMTPLPAHRHQFWHFTVLIGHEALRAARLNRDLVMNVWKDAMVRSHLAYLDPWIEWEIEKYTLQGVSFVSAWAGFITYVCYDLSVHSRSIAAGAAAFPIAVLLNLALLLILSLILMENRARTARKLYGALRRFLILAYDQANAPAR